MRLNGSSIRDPDLKQRRVRNDNRLKSIFESIFDKYSKSFEGVGDEIDLRSGEIVVNNGHLLGIKSQTDTGNIKDSDDTSIAESEKDGALQEDSGEGEDRESILASETALQALYVVDSFGEGGIIDTPPASLGKSLVEQIAEENSEEDELADKTVEWVTPREARAISAKKWQLPDCGPTFSNEEVIEEAWRAPMLPDQTPSRVANQRVPTVKQVRREEIMSDTMHEPSVDQPLDTTFTSPGATVALTPSSSKRTATTVYSDKNGRKVLPWTLDEEDRLRDIKANTALTYRMMEHLFPDRHKESIACKWTQMVKRGDPLTTAVLQKLRDTPSSQMNRAKGSTSLQLRKNVFETNHEHKYRNMAAGVSRSGDTSARLSSGAVNSQSSIPEPLGLKNSDEISSSQRLQENEEEMLPSSRFREDADRRRKQLVKSLDPECFEITEKDNSLLLFRSRGSNVDEITINNPTEFILSSISSELHSKGGVPLVDLEEVAPLCEDSCTGQLHRTNPKLTFHATEQPKSPSAESQTSEKTDVQEPSMLRTSTEERPTVQVVIPIPKNFKSRVSTKLGVDTTEGQPKSHISGDDKISSPPPMPPEPRTGRVNSDVPLHRSGQSRLEVPDSQSGSSPLSVEKDQVTRPPFAVEKSRSGAAPFQNAWSRQINHRMNDESMADPELVDELSVVCSPKKTYNIKEVHSLLGVNQSPRRITSLAHRPRKSSKQRAPRAAIAGSFSSAVTDMYDCSEDELSFM